MPATPSASSSGALDKNFFLKCVRKEWKSEFNKEGDRKKTSGEVAELPGVGVDLARKPQDYDLYIIEHLLPLIAAGMEQLTAALLDRKN